MVGMGCAPVVKVVKPDVIKITKSLLPLLFLFVRSLKRSPVSVHFRQNGFHGRGGQRQRGSSEGDSQTLECETQNLLLMSEKLHPHVLSIETRATGPS